MQFNLSLTIEQINTILRALDQQPHAAVRQTIDYVISEVNAQQQAAAAAAQQAQQPADSVGGTD